VNSMSDLFHPGVDQVWIDFIFKVMMEMSAAHISDLLQNGPSEWRTMYPTW